MRTPTCLVAALLLVPGPVVAGEDPYPYSIDVHFTAASYAGCEESAVADAALSCDAITSEIDPVGSELVFAWIVVGQVPPGTGAGQPGGIAGIQFGIEYDPTLVVQGWSLCTGGTEIAEEGWPKSGNGNAMIWEGGCHLVEDNEDGVTRVGFFPLRANGPGQIRVTDDPRVGIAQAADCETVSTRICRQVLGVGGVAGASGETTCGYHCFVARPVRPTSWGAIKAQY